MELRNLQIRHIQDIYESQAKVLNSHGTPWYNSSCHLVLVMEHEVIANRLRSSRKKTNESGKIFTDVRLEHPTPTSVVS